MSLLAFYVYADEEAKQRFARPNKQINIRSSSLALHVFSFQRDRGYDESSVQQVLRSRALPIASGSRRPGRLCQKLPPKFNQIPRWRRLFLTLHGALQRHLQGLPIHVAFHNTTAEARSECTKESADGRLSDAALTPRTSLRPLRSMRFLWIGALLEQLFSVLR